MGKNDKAGKLLQGALILTVAAIVTKLIGALQKIPLQNIGGDGVFGIYNTVYPFYTVLITIAAAGFPVAISKFVAEYEAAGDKRGGKRVARLAYIVLGTFGLVLGMLTYVSAPLLGKWIDNAHVIPSIRAASAACLFIPLMAAMRGYFQGLQNMIPTAVSQVTEQLIRVTVMIVLLLYMIGQGFSPDWIAAGAMLGSAAGGAAGLCIMLIYWWRANHGRSSGKRPPYSTEVAATSEVGMADGLKYKSARTGRADRDVDATPLPDSIISEQREQEELRTQEDLRSHEERIKLHQASDCKSAQEHVSGLREHVSGFGERGYAQPEYRQVEKLSESELTRPGAFKLLRSLMRYALPVCLGSLAIPLISMADTFTVPRLLKQEGLGEAEVMVAFGIYNRGLPLVQLVMMLATSLTALFIPALAEAKFRGDDGLIRRQSGLALRWSWLLGLAAAAGLAILAEPINRMLYKDAVGSDVMSWLALSAAGGTASIISAALLQGLGAVRAPALHLLAAAALKAALNVLLVPVWGTTGAAIAGAAAYTLAAVLNTAQLARLAGLRTSWSAGVLKPAVMLAAMVLAAASVSWGTGAALGALGYAADSRTAAMAKSLLGVAAGAAGFMLAAVRMRLLTEAELLHLPKLGSPLVKLLRRFRLLS
ncbi:putative cell division protein YtgP [compost metagenome]